MKKGDLVYLIDNKTGQRLLAELESIDLYGKTFKNLPDEKPLRNGCNSTCYVLKFD